MKKLAKNEEMIKAQRDSLFEPTPKNDDLTPVIVSNIELEMPQPRSAAAAELFGDGGGDNYPFDEASIADTIPKKKKFLNSHEKKKKKKKNQKQRKREKDARKIKKQ